LTAFLWISGLRRLLWTQLAAALVLLVPLMGFVLPFSGGTKDHQPSLRVLSFNVNSAYAGFIAVADQILAQSPDVVLLQESPSTDELVDVLHVNYPHVHKSTQFIIASRFPITETTDPDRLDFGGRQRSPRFMRYVVDSPLGKLAIYSVHPISPRGALNIREYRAAFHQLRTGEIFNGQEDAEMEDNAGLRATQIAAVARYARKEVLPVIIAGDTNLPGLSRVYRDNLARYTDGFRAGSWGFGYTFPARFPLLRLDRILAGEALRFAAFRIGCKGASDHLCVVADIQSAAPAGLGKSPSGIIPH
jgi:vancomycin resistance protein VanJ